MHSSCHNREKIKRGNETGKPTPTSTPAARHGENFTRGVRQKHKRFFFPEKTAPAGKSYQNRNSGEGRRLNIEKTVSSYQRNNEESNPPQIRLARERGRFRLGGRTNHSKSGAKKQILDTAEERLSSGVNPQEVSPTKKNLPPKSDGEKGKRSGLGKKSFESTAGGRGAGNSR